MAPKFRAQAWRQDEFGRTLIYARSGLFDTPLQGPPILHDVDTIQKFPLGTRVIVGEDEYVYAEFGGTTAAGDMIQAEAPAAEHDDLNPSGGLVAIGSEKITLVAPGSGTDDIILNEYAEGTLQIETDTGKGYKYKIRDNEALDISEAADRAVINLWDPIAIALDSTSNAKLIKSPWKEVIQMPAAVTARVIGAGMGVGADGSFGWVQTAGEASVLTDGGVVIGQHVRASDATPGAVEALDRDGTAEDEPELGVVVDVGGSGLYSLIRLSMK